MKSISLWQAFIVWVVICIIAAWFVPSSLPGGSFISSNAYWLSGLLLASWWVYGYIEQSVF